MRNSTLKEKTFGIILLAFILGIQAVSAQGYPTVKELYGRYKFSGECTYVDMMTGKAAEAPVPAVTDYDMAVLPGEGENEVKILGFFGYGGGVIATYDAEKGVLKCTQEAAYFCGNMDAITGEGVMAFADAGEGGQLDYIYTVIKKDEGILITSTTSLNASYMNGTDGKMGSLSYAAGYTLQKENNMIAVSSTEGDYNFLSENVVSTFEADAIEEFKLTVKVKGGNKVSMSGLFGFADEIEVDYYEDGGVFVLPSAVTFANGLFMGANEGDPDNIYDDVYPVEDSPYFYVEDGKLVTPCSFYVYGMFDDVYMMRNVFSFLGGEAVKDGSSVSSRCIRSVKIYGADGTIRVDGDEDTVVRVYDVQGVQVASAEGATIAFDGLKSGLYLVKVGDQATKVVVK